MIAIRIPARLWTYRLLWIILWLLSVGLPEARADTRLTFLAIGDSKTYGTATGCGQGCIVGYEPYLEKAGLHEIQPRLGHPGYSLADLVRAYDHDAATVQVQPDVILLDIGTNDVRQSLPDAFIWHWRYDLLMYIQRWHARFPGSKILIAFPRNYAPYSEAQNAWLDSSIQYVLSEQCINLTPCTPYAFPGIQEASYLRSNSFDGVHPTRGGYRLEAVLWLDLLR